MLLPPPVALHERERRISTLLARQHGVVSLQQLHACGLDSAAITRRLRSSRLVRLFPAVYGNVPWRSLSAAGQQLAATLSVRGSAISHETAAREWGIWPTHRCSDPAAIDLVAQRGCRRARPGVTVRVSSGFDPRIDACLGNGASRTTVARTVADLGAVLTPWQLACAWHEADFWLKPARGDIHDSLGRMGSAASVSVVRRAERLLDAGSIGTQSSLEDMHLAWLLDNDRVEPWVNRHVGLADGGSLRLDFAWVEQRLVIEVDGSGHVREHTRADDAAKERRILESGFELVRLQPWQVRHPDPALLARIPARTRR